MVLARDAGKGLRGPTRDTHARDWAEDMNDDTSTRTELEGQDTGGASSRRALLKLGAMAAPAVVTLRPAWATGGHSGGGGGGDGGKVSLAMCRIPIDKDCDKDGKPRYGGYDGMTTADASSGDDTTASDYSGYGRGRWYSPPPKGFYYGQELIDYETSGRLPDGVYSVEQFEAHIKYIKRLGPGESGFTCLTSLVHKL